MEKMSPLPFLFPVRQDCYSMRCLLSRGEIWFARPRASWCGSPWRLAGSFSCWRCQFEWPTMVTDLPEGEYGTMLSSPASLSSSSPFLPDVTKRRLISRRAMTSETWPVTRAQTDTCLSSFVKISTLSPSFSSPSARAGFLSSLPPTVYSRTRAWGPLGCVFAAPPPPPPTLRP